MGLSLIFTCLIAGKSESTNDTEDIVKKGHFFSIAALWSFHVFLASVSKLILPVVVVDQMPTGHMVASFRTSQFLFYQLQLRSNLLHGALSCVRS